MIEQVMRLRRQRKIQWTLRLSRTTVVVQGTYGTSGTVK